jgi:hypothetical protein
VDDAPEDGIGTPQQAARGREIAASQRLTDARAADAGAVTLEGGHPHDLDSTRLPERTEECIVAPAPLPEAEVVAYHEPARPEPLDQDPVDEVLGRLCREPRAEAQAHEVIDTIVTEEQVFLAQAREAWRRRPGVEVFARLRFEDQRHGG